MIQSNFVKAITYFECFKYSVYSTTETSIQLCMIDHLEKSMYSPIIKYNVLHMSVRSILFILLFKYAVSLLILSLDNLSIVESGVSKSSTVILLLFISLFISWYLLYMFRHSNAGHINT